MVKRSEGPFSAGKCQVHDEMLGVYDGAAVFDSEGAPFCLIEMDNCIGGDLAAAKARATRIAEALNRSEGHDRVQPFEPSGSYRDNFRDVGQLRAAAFQLSDALRGTEHHDLAAELHDSICAMLPGSADLTARAVREMIGHPDHPAEAMGQVPGDGRHDPSWPESWGEPVDLWKPAQMGDGSWQAVLDRRLGEKKTRTYDFEEIRHLDGWRLKPVRFAGEAACENRCAILNCRQRLDRSEEASDGAR